MLPSLRHALALLYLTAFNLEDNYSVTVNYYHHDVTVPVLSNAFVFIFAKEFIYIKPTSSPYFKTTCSQIHHRLIVVPW